MTTSPKAIRVGTLVELGRFAAAGAAATAVETAVFAGAVAVGVPPLVANPITMALRLFLSFWLTRNKVFRSRVPRSTHVELILFVALAGVNVFAVEATLWLATMMVGGPLGVLAATVVKVAAICSTLIGRYLVSRRYIFRAEPTREPAWQAGSNG